LAGNNSTIQLTTPAADARPNPDTIIKPQALHAWVNDLPYANPLGATQAILASLKLLNRHPSKLSQRTELMLIYMEPFNRIIAMARKLSCTIQDGQNQARDGNEMLTLAEAICTEMSYGFKHIVNNEGQPNKKTSPEDIASHIQLAMHCLSLGLMFEMSSYHKESRSAWREIFQLLIRAQQLGVANTPITTSQFEYEVSVLNSFKCILLTSILDSTRLRPEETWASYDYLQWYAMAARLIPMEQASEHPGNYLMPIDGTDKPVLFGREKPPSDPTKYMLCETHRLNLQVNRHLEMLSTDESVFINGTEDLLIANKKQMLRQMLHIWHTNPRRRHKRSDKFDRLSCAFGVNSVYHFLKNGSMRKTAAAGQEHSSPNQEYLITHTGKPNLAERLHTYEFLQEDTSASGIGILSSEQEVSDLKIGQLIIVESKIGETPGKLQVGVVRRIVKQNHITTEVGVQHLPGTVLTATTLPEIFGHKHHADQQPCLLLELGGDHPKAIITPHLIYQANRHYVLDVTGGDTKRVIAGRLLESTGCFDCFEYNILQHT